MYHLGSSGNIRIRRSVGRLPATEMRPADVNASLNRFSFPEAEDNIITGDRLSITTTDPRGLAFFAFNSWASGQIEDNIIVYAHINQAGGIRAYTTFADAIAGDRTGSEVQLQGFTGDPIPVLIELRDADYNLLGDVTSYSFNTEREAIDTTALSDKFRNQYNAGLLTGSGTIDCLFQPEADPCSDCSADTGRELSLLLLQVIQRVDVGAQFDLYLSLVDPGSGASYGVFYELHAVATKTGVEVAPDELINCSIDFVTTGEFRLRLGSPAEYILQETDFRIEQERELGFLLKSTDD